MKAIATEYNGYQFRSQLEARWAFFFDSILIPYIYEIDGYKLNGGSIWYRPDFWLPRHHEYVEIKPFTPTRDELDKAYHLALESKHNVWVMCGDPYGLLEVHNYFYVPMIKEVWDALWTMIKGNPDIVSLFEHISEDCIIGHQIGDLIHYYTRIDADSAIHATSRDDLGILIQFSVGSKKPEDDIVWDISKSFFDLAPDLSALVPEEARKARMHQFWRPRAHQP